MHPVFFGAVEHVNTLRYTVTIFFNQSNKACLGLTVEQSSWPNYHSTVFCVLCTVVPVYNKLNNGSLEMG